MKVHPKTKIQIFATYARLYTVQCNIALTAMGSNVTSQQSHAPNFSTDPQTPLQSMNFSATALSRGNRGGGKRGNASNRGSRDGGTRPGQGGTKRSNNPRRQKTISNHSPRLW